MSINYQFGYVSEFKKSSYSWLTTNCAITHEPFAFFLDSKWILKIIFKNHFHVTKSFSCHKIILQNHFHVTKSFSYHKIIFMSQNHFHVIKSFCKIFSCHKVIFPKSFSCHKIILQNIFMLQNDSPKIIFMSQNHLTKWFSNSPSFYTNAFM